MSDDMARLGGDGISRSLDEHYDTMMDVEQDPTGAWLAIQSLYARVAELEAALDREKAYAAELEAVLARAVEGLESMQKVPRSDASYGIMAVMISYALAAIQEAKP